MANQAAPSGVICIDKPVGFTSHDVVNRVRRLFGTRQVGHTGTLDPMASGVLVVMVGRAVKASEFLVSDDKAYQARLRLGETYDSGDITGTKLTTFCRNLPTRVAVLDAISSFQGEIFQTPPMYSALKIDGKKLVDIARKGIEIDREARKISIHSIHATATENPAEYDISVACSKGTYIRVLCEDIGAKLGCGGTLAALRRTKSGNFSLENAHTLEQLQDLTPEQLAAQLLPTESLFDDLPRVNLPDFFARLAACGCPIYQHKIGTSFEQDDHPLVTLYDQHGFFALAHPVNLPDGNALKPVKQFRI